MNLSLKPGNAPTLLAVRRLHAMGLSGIAAGSLPVLDIDVLRMSVSIGASDVVARLP